MHSHGHGLAPEIFMGSSAPVLFSHGQNSATRLAWALERDGHVETMGYDDDGGTRSGEPAD